MRYHQRIRTQDIKFGLGFGSLRSRAQGFVMYAYLRGPG